MTTNKEAAAKEIGNHKRGIFPAEKEQEVVDEDKSLSQVDAPADAAGEVTLDQDEATGIDTGKEGNGTASEAEPKEEKYAEEDAVWRR